MRKKLTKEQRQDLFSAEMTLSRILRHLRNRLDLHLPYPERKGIECAIFIAWTLYRVAWKEQQQ